MTLISGQGKKILRVSFYAQAQVLFIKSHLANLVETETTSFNFTFACSINFTQFDSFPI